MAAAVDLTSILKRPDPMIYSQYWLMKRGLSVTWDNPDIQLFEPGGGAVDPTKLERAHDYEGAVQCWNNSYDAGVPAPPRPSVLLNFRHRHNERADSLAAHDDARP
jgi:hypothetical protein